MTRKYGAKFLDILYTSFLVPPLDHAKEVLIGVVKIEGGQQFALTGLHKEANAKKPYGCQG